MSNRSTDHNVDFDEFWSMLKKNSESNQESEGAPHQGEEEHFDASIFDTPQSISQELPFPQAKERETTPQEPQRIPQNMHHNPPQPTPQTVERTPEEQEAGWSLNDYLPQGDTSDWLSPSPTSSRNVPQQDAQQELPKQTPQKQITSPPKQTPHNNTEQTPHPAQGPQQREIAQAQTQTQSTKQEEPVQQPNAPPAAQSSSSSSYDDNSIVDEKAGTFDWSVYDNYDYTKHGSDNSWLESLQDESEWDSSSKADPKAITPEDAVNQEINKQLEQIEKEKQQSGEAPSQQAEEPLLLPGNSSVEKTNTVIAMPHVPINSSNLSSPGASCGQESSAPSEAQDLFSDCPPVDFAAYLNSPEDAANNEEPAHEVQREPREHRTLDRPPTSPFSIPLPSPTQSIPINTVIPTDESHIIRPNNDISIPHTEYTVPQSADNESIYSPLPQPSSLPQSPFQRRREETTSMHKQILSKSYPDPRINFLFTKRGLFSWSSQESRVEKNTLLPAQRKLHILQIKEIEAEDHRRKSVPEIEGYIKKIVGEEYSMLLGFLSAKNPEIISSQKVSRRPTAPIEASFASEEVNQALRQNDWASAFFLSEAYNLKEKVIQAYAKTSTCSLSDYFYLLLSSGYDALSVKQMKKLGDDDIFDLLIDWMYILKAIVIGKSKRTAVFFINLFFENDMVEEAITALFISRSVMELDISSISSSSYAVTIYQILLVYQKYFNDTISLSELSVIFLQSIHQISVQKSQKLYSEIKDMLDRDQRKLVEEELGLKSTSGTWGLSGLMTVVDAGISKMIAPTEAPAPQETKNTAESAVRSIRPVVAQANMPVQPNAQPSATNRQPPYVIPMPIQTPSTTQLPPPRPLPPTQTSSTQLPPPRPLPPTQPPTQPQQTPSSEIRLPPPRPLPPMQPTTTQLPPPRPLPPTQPPMQPTTTTDTTQLPLPRPLPPMQPQQAPSSEVRLPPPRPLPPMQPQQASSSEVRLPPPRPLPPMQSETQPTVQPPTQKQTPVGRKPLDLFASIALPSTSNLSYSPSRQTTQQPLGASSSMPSTSSSMQQSSTPPFPGPRRPSPTGDSLPLPIHTPMPMHPSRPLSVPSVDVSSVSMPAAAPSANASTNEASSLPAASSASPAQQPFPRFVPPPPRPALTEEEESKIDYPKMFSDTNRYRIVKDPADENKSWLGYIPGITGVANMLRRMISRRNNIPIVELAQNITFIYDKVEGIWITVDSRTLRPIKPTVTTGSSSSSSGSTPESTPLPPPAPEPLKMPTINGPMPQRGPDGKLLMRGPTGNSLEARYGKCKIPADQIVHNTELPLGFVFPQPPNYGATNIKVFVPTFPPEPEQKPEEKKD
ncbi:hypothetical protein NEFER01_1243 [Nematocida sp. LUAm1]|nr:hypothetical protein NEFER02_0654 [Nematocida sp. LUAm2]KAI5178061.1 hypothetical protein NEFER01_1243 [Nematocida sp. LUAm1]